MLAQVLVAGATVVVRAATQAWAQALVSECRRQGGRVMGLGQKRELVRG